MLSKSQTRQFGAFLRAMEADTPQTITAGAGNDGVEVNGDYVAIPDAAGTRRPESAALVLCYRTVLAATETLTLTANGQDADDASGTGVADFDVNHALDATVVATGPTGGATVIGGIVAFTLNLVGASTHIRAQITQNLSASGTDTSVLQAFWIFGGDWKEPVIANLNDS